MDMTTVVNSRLTTGGYMKNILDSRANVLFIILAGFFIANALIAELIGVKIFALEETLGIERFDWNLFEQTGSLSFSAGVLLWPVVFVMTDVINEYYGRKGVQMLSIIAVGLIVYTFAMIYAAISLAPTDWWVPSNADNNVPDMQAAFVAIFGQGLWIMGGSIVAFFVGQIVDVLVFHKIKKITGEKKIWLRATGSTLISQLIDSFIVLYIAFVLGPQQWSMEQFLAVGTVNYSYKFLMAVALTPVIYLAHKLIDSYLGKQEACEMKLAATAA